LNLEADFRETCYEQNAIGGHSIVIRFKFLLSLLQTWRWFELLRWKY